MPIVSNISHFLKAAFHSKGTPAVAGVGTVAGIALASLGPALFLFAGVNVLPMALLAGGGGALVLTSLTTAGAWTTVKIVRHIKNSDARRINNFLRTEPSAQQINDLRYGNDNDTLLIRAVRSSSASEVEALLEAGADPNAKNKLGVTPLFLACFIGDPEKVELLTEKGANVNAVDIAKETPLHAAAYGINLCLAEEDSENVKTIIAHLISKGANPQARNDKGQRPFDIVEEEEYKDLFV